MLASTTCEIRGHEIVEHKGLVRGIIVAGRFLAAVWVAAVFACQSVSAAEARAFVGAWRHADQAGLVCDVVFRADGTFGGKFVAGTATLLFEGAWSVAGDRINYVYSKPADVGKDVDRIIEVRADRFTIEAKGGVRRTYLRVDSPAASKPAS